MLWWILCACRDSIRNWKVKVITRVFYVRVKQNQRTGMLCDSVTEWVHLLSAQLMGKASSKCISRVIIFNIFRIFLKLENRVKVDCDLQYMITFFKQFSWVKNITGGTALPSKSQFGKDPPRHCLHFEELQNTSYRIANSNSRRSEICYPLAYNEQVERQGPLLSNHWK